MTSGALLVLVARVSTRLLERRQMAQRMPPAIYEMCLTGDGGGTFQIIVDRLGARAVMSPASLFPTSRVTLAFTDAERLVTGKMSTFAAGLAFATGKFKVEGDTEAASRLGQLLR